jgi:succinate dehydrogenase/fumarate reductase flavoprotein subunit
LHNHRHSHRQVSRVRSGSPTADVIVVGAGGSGLAAAVEAASLGCSVVVLEKAPAIGGTTRRAVGSVTANCTAHQVRVHIQDSPNAHFEDLGLLARPLNHTDNLALRRLLTSQIADTFRWLASLGISFYGPMPEPPHRYPRMHTALPNAGAYIHCLKRKAINLGVRIDVNTVAHRLLHADGRITGVQATNQGSELQYQARRGLIIATGDYSANYSMKAKYMPERKARVQGINPLSTGDGHKMALEVGARIVNGDLSLGPELRFVAPPKGVLTNLLPGYPLVGRVALMIMSHTPSAIINPLLMKLMTTNLSPSNLLFEKGAILINKQSRRFSNELENPAVPVFEQVDGEAFIVFDQKVADLFSKWPYAVSTAPGFAYAYLQDYARSRRDIFYTAENLPGLAKKIQVRQAQLLSTIDTVNRCRESEIPDAYGRSPLGNDPIASPPFYALGPVQSYIAVTDGGLAINGQMQVLGPDDRGIPGLFAAGSAGQGGLLLEGHGHHLGWAFVSGRLAGKSAALMEETIDAPGAESINGEEP